LNKKISLNKKMTSFVKGGEPRSGGGFKSWTRNPSSAKCGYLSLLKRETKKLEIKIQNLKFQIQNYSLFFFFLLGS